MHKILNYYLVLLLCFSAAAYAFTIDTDPQEKKTFQTCPITKSTSVTEKPKQIIKDNNLTQNLGNFTDKLMPKIILLGRVRDKNCLPVPNVEVTMWQTDEYGIRRFVSAVDTKKSIYSMNNQMYSKFEGDGSVISNNLGEFGFVTVRPKQGNNINIVMTHDKYPELKTRIVLLEKDAVMPKTKYVIAENSKTLGSNGFKVYFFDIVLDGKEEYLSY